MILSIVAIIISSIAVIISVLTFYFHFLLKAKVAIEYSNDNTNPYIVERQIDGKNYKWVRIKAYCSNNHLSVSARNLRLKMLKVERYNHENGHWIELNPINLFYLRWVIDNENNVFTFQGDLTRFEPQYFNIATMISEGNKKLLYPGIPNQGNVAGWKPEEWFKEGLFRYTIGVYGDNVRPSNNKNYEYNITIKFKQDGKISFYEER